MHEPLSLNTLAGSFMLRRQALSERVAISLVRLFSINVIGTVFLTVILSGIDAFFIWHGKISPADRLISEKVFIMIVGATTVQLGLGIGAIVAALFKQPGSGVASAEDASE
jgi:hypothetical protein